jgi:hypothetical protein
MQKTYQRAYKPYSTYLKDYDSKLIFSIDTEPCVKFLKEMQKLHLSQKQGSISRTTEEQILEILRE